MNSSLKLSVLAAFAALQSTLLIAGGSADFLTDVSLNAKGPCNTLMIEPEANRLFALGRNKIAIVDLKKEKVSGAIDSVNDAFGFAIAPTLQRAFSSYPKSSEVCVFDLKKLSVLPKVRTAKTPGPILVEPNRWEVYAFSKDEKTASVYEADDSDFELAIKLPGTPTAAVADAKADRVYCAFGDKNEIIGINIRDRNVSEHWPISPGESAAGMVLNADHHQLVVTCSNNNIVLVDTKTGKVTSSIAIPTKPKEGTVYDSKTQSVFYVDQNGGIAGVRIVGGNLSLLPPLESVRGAEAVAINPMMRRLYTASSDSNGQVKLSIYRLK